jgi:hypothetical protein
LQMDNCGRENKNHAVLGLLGILVELRLFERIYLNFLPVGHTHALVDQRFSTISSAIRGGDYPTLDAMEEELKGTLIFRMYMTLLLRFDLFHYPLASGFSVLLESVSGRVFT